MNIEMYYENQAKLEQTQIKIKFPNEVIQIYSFSLWELMFEQLFHFSTKNWYISFKNGDIKNENEKCKNFPNKLNL